MSSDNLLNRLAAMNRPRSGSVDESTPGPLAKSKPDRLTALRSPDEDAGKSKTEKVIEEPTGMSGGTLAIAGVGFIAALLLGGFLGKKR